MGCSGSKQQQPRVPSLLPPQPAPSTVIQGIYVVDDSKIADEPAFVPVNVAADTPAAKTVDPLILVSDPAGTLASGVGGLVGGTVGLFSGIVTAATTLDPSAVYSGVVDGSTAGAVQANAGTKSAFDLVGSGVLAVASSVVPGNQSDLAWDQWVDGKPDGLTELGNNTSTWMQGGFSATQPDGWTVSKVTQKRIMRPQSEFLSYSTIASGVSAGLKWIDPNPPVWTQNHIDKKLPLEWWFPNQLWSPEVSVGMFKGDKASSGISISDCNQGDVGDCWFISAMALASMYPEVFKNVFSKIDAEKGIYEFTFFDEKTEKFVVVCVDERLPVITSYRTIVYCSSKMAGELWPVLLEKAYAKAFGSYTAIEMGSTAMGICNLLCKPPSLYVRIRANKELLRDPNALWVKLKNLHEEGHLLGNAFIDQVHGFNDTDKKGLDVDPNSLKWRVRNRETVNIISGHAYGIMALYDVEPGLRLVKIRNPWGRNSEWQGDWSDNSDKWKERPDVAKLVEFHLLNDGIFFMSIDDLSQQISNITACRVFEKGTPVVWKGLNYSHPDYTHNAPYTYVDSAAAADALAKARAPVA